MCPAKADGVRSTRNVGDLTLADEFVRWLRENFSEHARPDDLTRTYDFVHDLNHSQEVDTYFSRPDVFRWRVVLYDPTGTSSACASRSVEPSAPLIVGTRGRVAFKDSIRVTVQEQGLATEIYRTEEALFRTWNIAEIHLEAALDGLAVWVRKGFQPTDRGFFEARYAEWAEEKGRDPAPLASFAAYPEEFLRSLELLPMYKVLY
ncbi:hypothetical protein BH11MYX4_BH11MYX4_05480 [soil metagenome]